MTARFLLAVSASVAALTAGCVGNDALVERGASTCTRDNRYVSVGGTAGFNALADPRISVALRATGRVRLYEHANAVAVAIAGSPAANPYATLDAIAGTFDGTGPGEAELGLTASKYFTLPPARYHGYYRYQYVRSGLRPDAANVDVPFKPASAIRYTPANVRAWKEWVRGGRSSGIASMAPIVAPNAVWQAGNPIFPPTRAAYYDFYSAFYALSRFEASDGGAIALDTPPKFFLTGGSGPGYRHFIEQAIRWGNARGLRTTVLISPYRTRRHFGDDTKRFVRILAGEDSLPSEWAVDDYENTRPNDAAAVGPDSDANTTTGVALWLAENAPVFSDVAGCISGS